MKFANLFFVILSLSSATVYATPSQIIIIRHAEKPDDDKNPEVSPQGCERAYQLPNFFKNYSSNVIAIYGQQPDKASGSLRPLETIAPTSQALQIKINNNFVRDNTDGVASDIMGNPAYNGKTIFMAWEHTAIPTLATSLGLSVPANMQTWPSAVFDQAWILTYAPGQSAPQLTIVAEDVLPTDILPSQSGVANWGPENAPQNNGIVVPPSIITNCAAGNSSLDALVQQQTLVTVPGL